jgi:hypothetical protein
MQEETMHKIKDVAVQGSRNDGLVSFEEPRTIPEVKNKRKRKIRRKKVIGKYCSAQSVKVIEKMVKAKTDITEKEVFNSLKTNSIHKYYLGKGKEAKQLFRQDFRRIKFNLTSGRIPNPPNKVVKRKNSNNISKELLATKEAFDKTIFPTNDRIKISLSLMEQLYLEGNKSILNFPCASGKTTAAIMLAATYASSENRMWIVTQKVEDVCNIAIKLKVLGASAVEWHGRPNYCPKSREEFMTKKACEFCGPCESKCTAHYKYLSESPWDNENFDILVTTHSHWQAAVSSNKFSSSVKFVIVDESPNLMEYYTIDEEVKESILSIFQYSNELAGDFKAEMRFVEGTLSNRACHRIPPLLSIRKSKEIQKCIHKLFQNGELAADVFENVKSFINFFMAKEIYGIKDGNSGMSFIRGEVDLETKIPHMVLDGSALMNDVLWKGFKIYECEDLKQTYPNTTIDVVDGNPSKKFLRNKDNFNDLLNMTVESIKKHHHVLESKNPVVIFRNKELDNDKGLQENISQLQGLVNEMGLEFLDMCRGEHIGSNRGKDAVLCAIAMGLFKTISHYVLRTALVTRSEISAGRIWKGEFNSPKMKTNGGFADPEIQHTYCRSVVVDLYQTIMRGCVRDNPEAHYNVVCVLKGPEIFSILERELPGADFNVELDPIVSALWAGKSDTEILKEHDIKRTSLKNLKKYLSIS